MIDIKIVFNEIGHSFAVIIEKYAKCSLRSLQDDFSSLKEVIVLSLVPFFKDP